MTTEIDALLCVSFALMTFGVLVLYRQSEATYLTLTALAPLSLLAARFVDPRNEPAIFGLSASASIGIGVLFYITMRSLIGRRRAAGVSVQPIERVDELDLDEMLGSLPLRPGQRVTLELLADGVLRSGKVVETVTGGFTLDDGRLYLVGEVKRLEISV